MSQKFFVGLAFLIFFSIVCSGIVSAQNSYNKVSEFDTVFLAPDTVKQTRVDTVFEYEEEAPLQKLFPKKQEKSFFIGTQSGVGISTIKTTNNSSALLFQNGIRTMFVYHNFVLLCGFSIFGKESITNSITKHYTSYRHWSDTVRTVLDEYVEIIGNDTIHTKVIKTSLIPKTDTTYSDSTFKHTNKYRCIQIPLMFGYCYKTEKTIISLAAGPSFRFLIADKLNLVSIGDSSFSSETSYFKKRTIDFACSMQIKQKIFHKLWITCGVNGFIPLQSNYQSYNAAFNRTSYHVYFGFDYLFSW